MPPRSTRCARPARRSTGCTPGCRSSWCPAAPRPTSPPTSPKPLSPKDIRRWRSSSSDQGRTAPTRTTSAPTVNCAPATSSSSTSAAPTNPATTPTPPAPTASASRTRTWRGGTRCCSGRSRPRSRRCGPGSPREQVDAAARDVLAAEGLAEAFVHRTGHGIGLVGARGALHRRGQRPAARGGHGVQRRAGHLLPRPVGRPHRGHRHRHRRRRACRSTTGRTSWSWCPRGPSFSREKSQSAARSSRSDEPSTRSIAHLDHHAPRVGPRSPVALRVAQFGVADGVGVGVDAAPCLPGTATARRRPG